MQCGRATSCASIRCARRCPASSISAPRAGRELSDVDEIEVVTRQVKQRADSFAEFEKAGRTELAEKERKEREILLAYLPAQTLARGDTRDRAERLSRTARRSAQHGRRHEGRDAPTQRRRRRQPRPPNRHRRTGELTRCHPERSERSAVILSEAGSASGVEGRRIGVTLSEASAALSS